MTNEQQADADAEVAEWVNMHFREFFAGMDEPTKAKWRKAYKAARSKGSFYDPMLAAEHGPKDTEVVTLQVPKAVADLHAIIGDAGVQKMLETAVELRARQEWVEVLATSLGPWRIVLSEDRSYLYIDHEHHPGDIHVKADGEGFVVDVWNDDVTEVEASLSVPYAELTVEDFSPKEDELLVLTDDDCIHAAQTMERKGAAGRNLGGHFAGYMGEAYVSLAKAYYHADKSNQRTMRKDFDPLFRKFLAEYKKEQP